MLPPPTSVPDPYYVREFVQLWRSCAPEVRVSFAGFPAAPQPLDPLVDVVYLWKTQDDPDDQGPFEAIACHGMARARVCACVRTRTWRGWPTRGYDADLAGVVF